MTRPHPYRPAAPIFNPQPKPVTWRSEAHRRRVSTMSCVVCGRWGPSQSCHANATKAMSLKASDALLFPACPSCHSYHDSGGIPKDERSRRELGYVEKTREDLISVDMWPDDVEGAYQAAIVPLRAVVVPIED